MAELSIDTVGGRRQYRPGEEVVGAAAWRLDEPPRTVEVRLFWRTEGKGTRDVGVVASERFENPQATEVREFRFTLPPGPYSFSGRLVSLIWALEAVAAPGGEAARIDITVSPTGQEVHVAG